MAVWHPEVFPRNGLMPQGGGSDGVAEKATPLL